MSTKWIWENDKPGWDEYTVFHDEFDVAHSDDIQLYISADSRYEAFLNGECVGFGQYADYPHYKVADSLDLSKACREGRNSLEIVVWYYGESSSCYIPGQAGLFFEVRQSGNVLSRSSEKTLCAKEPHYQSGRCKKITGQLGYGFRYDSRKTDPIWHKAVATGYETTLHDRPIELLETLPERHGKIIKTDNDGRRILLDLGCEEVGLLDFELESDGRQTITISWGEHIEDGWVRRLIGSRDFSVEYIAEPGPNHYTNWMRRFGGRYLEFSAENPVRLKNAGFIPVMYPVKEVQFDAGTPTRQAIYDVCVRTLRLCMHEHYEDCPWREQALYAMDGRNQIVAGFAAFGETRFPRACLALMAQDRREDGLLSITSPCGTDLAIPSFSLHWFTEMREYAEYSGDLSLIKESWNKLCSVLDVFLKRRKNGVVMSFTEACHWNFYEWAPGLEGSLHGTSKENTDLIINSLTALAVESMAKMSEMSGCTLPFDAEATNTGIREAAHNFFLDSNNRFEDFQGSGRSSQLGTSLAILSGIATGDEAIRLARELVLDPQDSGLTGITLSMKCFLYDALLKVDANGYREFILSDIEKVYKKMLDAGATSVWETEKGQADFGNAGSLCHGWSAMPVYYYHKLLSI